MGGDNYDRDALVNRILPQMEFANGETNLPAYHTSKPATQYAAAGRFAVKGNAISTFWAVSETTVAVPVYHGILTAPSSHWRVGNSSSRRGPGIT